MRKDTVEQLKNMYRNAKKREEEYKQEFQPNSYNNGYAHGMVVAYREMLETLSVFERVNMFGD